MSNNKVIDIIMTKDSTKVLRNTSKIIKIIEGIIKKL